MAKHIVWFPVLVVCGYQVGRGVGNTLLGLFALVGLLVFLPRVSVVIHRCRLLSFLYLAFIAVFLGSTLLSPTGDQNFKYLIAYVLASSVLLQLQVYRLTINARTLQNAGWIGLSAGGVFVVQFIATAIEKGDGFSPAHDVNGMVAAVLLPWLLLSSFKYKWWVLSGIFGLLLVSDSRTEVLSVLAAVAVYFAVRERRIGLLLISLPLALLFAISVDAIISGRALEGGSTYELLNRLSSQRLAIWNQVVEHSPDISWLGSGVYSSVGAEFIPKVRHFHNAFLELWFEVGPIGGVIFLLMLGHLGVLAGNRYRMVSGENLHVLATLGAVFVSVVVVLFLDKAMHSVFGRFYLFYVMGLFYLWSTQLSGGCSESFGKVSERG